MKEKKNNEYIIAIFSAVLGIILTAFYDTIKEKPILSTFWNILKLIWQNIFEFEIKFWQLLLFFVVIFNIRIIVFSKKKSDIKQVDTNDWLSYVEDTIDGTKWRWKWTRNPLNHKFNISELTIVCNKCETSMHLEFEYGTGNYAVCPRCENKIYKFKDIDKVELIIIDNINRDLYKLKNK
ncbi:MAG TPA: hypothetical protein DIT47_06000 [Flavobacteriaceae bacterium]|nr:hypothetical protein [Flavobacteriaceae bacterium]